MPKSIKRRLTGHEQSAKSLAKRRLVVAGAKAEHVDIGSKVELTGNEVLESMVVDANENAKPMKKKEKHNLKHELLLKRLKSSTQPHSKSHERRLKRKAKEDVGGGLTEMHAVITAVEAAEAALNLPVVGEPERVDEDSVKGPQTDSKFGQIGQGKGATLTKTQRKRALQAERLRMPLIRSNPQFAANPFETIRTHAQNTLVKHQVPKSSS